MENEKALVKAAETRLPKFVEDAYESIEKMERFAEILLNSKLVPNHFYEQLPDKKPDFSKGKIPAVVAVLIQGYQLQLPPLTALQHIIPVNGLLSLKGDLCKSMIFNSGKLKSGSWVEEETGSIEAGDYMVRITATRSDNGQTLSRSFSVAQAKRAGLWITEQQVNGQDGWKYKASAWWKYPSRMCNYRALGFLARDMFPDVMAGIYTTEEAMDLPKDTTEVIETESGAKITIPDKEHANKRSGKMTERVTDKIPENKFAPVDKKDGIQEAVVILTEEQQAEIRKQLPLREAGESTESFLFRYNTFVAESMKAHPELNFLQLQRDDIEDQFTPERGSMEAMDGKEIRRDEALDNRDDDNQFNLVRMEKMDVSVLMELINKDTDLIEAIALVPGKNTNKKLRLIIDAHQHNRLAEHVASYLGSGSQLNQEEEQIPPSNDIKPNKDFSNQGVKQSPGKELFAGEGGNPEKSVNKYQIEIPEEKPRDFSIQKQLYNKLLGIEPPINSPRYLELGAKLGYLTRYADKEIFVKLATIPEIDALLNEN
jgi:hypothetical protein